MIEFINVTKHYPGRRHVLRELNLQLGKGEMALLTGPSGAGKSTLLKLLTRLEAVSHGTLRVAGVDLATLRRRHIPAYRRRVGVVFQDHKLLMDRTVYANVALTLQVAGMSARQLDHRVRAALDKVGLGDHWREFPETLSGGEQQRVGIARAIVHTPEILLADEPTGNLDPELSSEILDMFRDFYRHGTTVLVATHDQGQVDRMGVRTLHLAHGQLQEKA
ncbi:cell division ATP-binding protein FtsE [Acidithiobacillus sp. CV18-2]|uniref:Cell division ATP-binding protein FtsE n=1 Tax=Igneacidithiobacillus copahuensis TaxID=2724909 RepID=A0AAE2YQF1_9PROT|nr:cell division ATP-binding protein FtsE [Igneacidithiobacillus copahuensis]MBU2753776.1 cell division ATP-binding protein FtsE [Acidithiobacillus sp. CV18-3]MBU2756526.1 cell division ATP-binding protein FtsE [Acidithiobacillus sp. BN09-2]MBU2776461.1 cell division ATP-binding protein FtsE [Acidithiobacillus sp. CV18-2]MBU2795201.1 cell division ATP-binding protein FtsE [Acidithiobacillus sp. VAN18-2]MBU2799171.1 cell division ATP-binding protein FtsE [Acidithiobacillus sp. VAN18-4]UTV81202